MGNRGCLHTLLFCMILLIDGLHYKMLSDAVIEDTSSSDCHKQRKIMRRLRIKTTTYDTLLSVTIACNRQNVVFEVRYDNSSYCVCGLLSSTALKFFGCAEKINRDVDLMVSVNQMRSHHDLCNVTLTFNKNKDGVEELKKIDTKLRFKDATVVTATTSLAQTSSTVTSLASTSTHITPSKTTSSLTTSSLNTSSITASTITTSHLLASSMTSFIHQNSSNTGTTTPLSPSNATTVVNRTATSHISPTISTSMVVTSSWSPDQGTDRKYREDQNFINNINVSSVNVQDENTISRVLDAATNLIDSNRTNSSDQESGMRAVSVLEDLGRVISQQLDLGEESQVVFQQNTSSLVFGAAVINTSLITNFLFPAKKNYITGEDQINVPQTVFLDKSDKAYFVGIIFNGVQEMQQNTGKDFVIGSKVINAKITPDPPQKLKDPVQMIFKKNIGIKSFGEDCSYWIEDASVTAEHGRWSTKQCYATFQNDTHIRCACTHFTNFAVLFKITDEEIAEEHLYRLQIITYVGLGLSILGCFLTFVIYMVLRNIKSDRSTIHKNLVLALGIADILFLVTIIIKPEQDTCTVLAMLTFFFYLSVFFWMFVEGIYIYLMVIKVFRGDTKKRRRIAYLVGWGCPIIIAVVTWVILRNDVISKYHCWLSVDTGAIWAFVGPGLLIILFNLVILMLVMRTTWATFVDDKEYGGLKSATKTFAAVIPILGITWVFGIMAFNESSLVFQYIFAIANSIQGLVIFIMYCLVNAEVRNEIRRKIVVWQTRRDVSSTSGRRPTYIISSEKNTTYNQSSRPTNNIEKEEEPYTARNYTFDDEVDKEGFELGINPSILTTSDKEDEIIENPHSLALV